VAAISGLPSGRIGWPLLLRMIVVGALDTSLTLRRVALGTKLRRFTSIIAARPIGGNARCGHAGRSHTLHPAPSGRDCRVPPSSPRA
jgi:hypothetical protein